MKTLKRFISDESGAEATEYVLLLGILALAIIFGVGKLSGALNIAFTNLATTVTSPP